MRPYVICMNDSVQFVFIGTSKEAVKKMVRLQKDYFICYSHNYKSFEDYAEIINWRIVMPEHNLDVTRGLDVSHAQTSRSSGKAIKKQLVQRPVQPEPEPDESD